MAAAKPSLTAPLVLAGLWLLTAVLSGLAALGLLLAVPYWHELRGYLAQLGLWQSWASIAACVGLLVLSRRRHAAVQEGWAQGPLLIYAMGGLLTALVLNYGALPHWLTAPGGWRARTVLLLLLAVHGGCAGLLLRGLLQYRRQTR